jgi:tRNA (cytidine/uridine-2'-O-)-methyltransferase
LFHVALYQPEIPPNTGNIIRLCANTGASLHLIHPLGFSPDDKQLQRAGLDYHSLAQVKHYQDYEMFNAQTHTKRLFAFSTRGTRCYSEVAYAADDIFLFGPETRGLPDDLLAELPPENVLRIPMLSHSRSLNLSNVVAVVVYEAWRQAGFLSGNK